MKKRYHVLYVDDDPFIRYIIQCALDQEFELTACTNGLEARTWLQAGHQPDVILTDLLMPHLGGRLC